MSYISALEKAHYDLSAAYEALLLDHRRTLARVEALERAGQLFNCLDWDCPTEHDDLLLETVREEFEQLLPKTEAA
jgi:hypothetical protein